MKRSLTTLALLACLATQAFADVCTAATEAATRTAIQSAEAAGRRTATVRVTCDGEQRTFMIHRRLTANGAAVTVREVSRPASVEALAGGKSASSTMRIIRVGK